MPLKLTYLIFCAALQVNQLAAQEPPTNQAENLVQFQSDVQPILEKNCLGCHGAKESKGELRVDELESLRGYVEVGNADASSLWTEYLNTKDPDAIMPPPNGAHPGGLSTAERLVIRTWINEGATGSWQAAVSNTETKADSPALPTTLPGKLFAFQGLFHPAAVHLPIALIAVSSMFVLFSFFNREACEPVAYHCLWIGALGAVAACVTGWSYAAHEGYGAGFSFDLERSSIDRHRWLGVFVAVFSLLMVPLARNVRRTSDINKRIIWFFAGLIMLGAVSIVGFQGGELTYGEGHYAKYYNLLFGSQPSPPPVLKEEMTETFFPGEEIDQPSEQVSDQPAAESKPKVEAKPKTAEPSQPSSPEVKQPASTPEPTQPKSSEAPAAEPKPEEASNPKTDSPAPQPSEPSSQAAPSTPPEKTEAPTQTTETPPTAPPQDPPQDPPKSESKLLNY